MIAGDATARRGVVILALVAGAGCTLFRTAPARLLRADEPSRAEVHALTLDGQSLRGPIHSLATHGNLSVGTPPTQVAWNEVRRLHWPSAVPTSPTAARAASDHTLVHLRPHGQVHVERLALKDERFQWQWFQGHEARTGIDSVAAILFPVISTTGDPAAERSLPAPAVDRDRLVVSSPAGRQVIEGLLEELSDTQVTLQFEGRTVQVPRERVAAIVLATPPPPKAPPSFSDVQFRDGQSLRARQLALAQSAAAPSLVDVEFGVDGAGQVPVTEFAHIENHSPRLQFLSDLAPLDVAQETLVTNARPWKRDRGVSGQPLTLSGQTFAKGLGVHASTRLTYLLDRRYESFVAVVGLDDIAAGRGDCLVSILGDEHVLWTERCRGGEPPRTVRIPVGDVKRLVLDVAAGEALDLADHVDWADAHLLRKKDAPRPK